MNFMLMQARLRNRIKIQDIAHQNENIHILYEGNRELGGVR